MNNTRLAPGWRALFQVGALLAVFNLAASWPPAEALGAEAGKPIRVVVLGDSLVAGFMLPPQAAFPVQLGYALKGNGFDVEIANAGVSGDTTAGGLERFEWAVPIGTDALILELGANDALRGLDPKIARENLDRILAKCKERGVEVLMAGMKAPQNWGEDYAARFDAMYRELAAAHAVALYPFFLDGVVLDPKLNLGDGLHPNPRGVAVIVERILPAVKDLLQRVEARRASHEAPDHRAHSTQGGF